MTWESRFVEVPVLHHFKVALPTCMSVYHRLLPGPEALHALFIFLPLALLMTPCPTHAGEPGSLTNLRLSGQIDGHDESLVALLVNERMEGNLDLNGDGDASDRVIHFYDLDSGVLHNTALAIAEGTVRICDGLAAFPVNERSQGEVALNGDTEPPFLRDDDVLHIFDRTSGTITNLGLAMGTLDSHLAMNDEVIAFSVPEGREQQDLNGDGDRNDEVVQLRRNQDDHRPGGGALFSAKTPGFSTRPGRHGSGIARGRKRTESFRGQRDKCGDSPGHPVASSPPGRQSIDIGG